MAKEREASFTVRIKDAGTAALKQIESAAEKTVEKLFGFKEVLGALTGAVAAFSLVDVIKDMVDLGTASDATFRQIAANLPTFTAGITELKEGIESLADVSGRALEEMEQSAAGIAKMGVGSAEELQQVLTASTMLADATGASVDESAQLLIQLRREFHLTGDEALDTAAKLASVSHGKIGITELQSAFAASAPVFLKFGIDADTGTRALGALVAQGYTTSRAIRSVIGSLDAQGIREYAGQVTVAADSLQQLETRAAYTRDGLDRLNQRIKNDFEKTAEEAGTKITEHLIRPLEGFTSALLKLAMNGNWTALQALMTGNVAGFAAELGRMERIAAIASGGFSGHGSSDSIGDDKPAPPHVLTAAENKALEDAAKTLRELNADAATLAGTIETAAPKSAQFAEAIGKWASKALEAGMDFAAFQGHLESMQVALAKMETSEAIKKQADDAQAAADAWVKLDQVFSEFSDNALTKFDASVEKSLNDLRKEAAKFTDTDGLLAYLDQIDAVKARFADLRTAVAETDATQKELNADLTNFNGDSVLSFMDKWTARAADVEIAMKTATDPARAAQLKKELDAINVALDNAGKGVTNIVPAVVDNSKHVRDMAQAWSTVGRSIIAAAQAVGGLDDKTAAALQNMVTLGDGVMKIFSGDILGGVSESLTSIAALGVSLFKHDDTQEKAILQAHVEAMKGLTAALLDVVRHGVAGVPGGANLSDTKSAISELRKQQSGGFFDGAILQDVAKQWGVAIDGTSASYRMFLGVLEAGLPILQEAYDTQQRQLQEDYHVRLLRAQGFTTEADAEEFAEQQQREMANAAKDAGLSVEEFAKSATGMALAAAQAAEATHALAKAALDKATGQAADDIAIDHITDPTKQFSKKAQAYKTAGGALGDLLGNFDLDHLNPADIAKLDSGFQDLFHQLEQSPETVDLAGLSIDDLKKALLDLGSSAKTVADSVETAAQAFSRANGELANDFDVDQTDATGQVKAYAGQYGFNLDQFDLTTKSGIDAAIAYFSNIYHYKGIDPTIKLQAKQMVDSLRGIHVDDTGGVTMAPTMGGGGPTSAVSSGYTSMTYLQADRLADLELRQVDFLGSMDGNLFDIRNDIRSWTTGRFNVGSVGGVNLPAAAQAFGAAAGSGGPIIVNVGGIKITSGTGASSDVVDEVTDKVIDRIERKLDQRFGRKVLVGKSYRGDITQ